MEGFINVKKIVLNIFDNYSMTRFQEEYMQGSLATSLMGREGGTDQHSKHWWAWNVGANMYAHVHACTHTMLYVHLHTCTHNAVCARVHMYTHKMLHVHVCMYTHNTICACVHMYTHTMLKLFATSEEGTISCSPSSHPWPLFHIPLLETRVMNIFTLDQITIFQF